VVGAAVAVLFVDIHSGHIRFTVALDHAQEFPAIPFIEPGVIGNQVRRRNAFRAQIVYGQIQ
jgi:hypothetical protein